MELESSQTLGEAAGLPPPQVSAHHAPDLLALVPLVFLVCVVLRYAVPVPFWDQWELVPLLDKSYHGQVTFHDLWEQHNEHRILFPKLIMLGLARLTHWDIRYELGATLLLALGILAVLARQVRATACRLNRPGLAWTIPAIAVVVFSVSQCENWLWGWQLQMVLNVLAAVAGLLLLAGQPFQWPRFAAALGLGIVATYSFANGILFWPLGFLILLCLPATPRQRVAGLVAWLAASGLVLWSYLWHYQKPAEHPPTSLAFDQPLDYAVYVLKYLGNIQAQYRGGSEAPLNNELALLLGGAALAGVVWAAWVLLRRRLVDLPALLPYLALSAYSVASALATGIGRVGFGSSQALASRYSVMGVPLWASLVVLLALLAQGKSAPAPDAARPALDTTVAPDSCGLLAKWSLVLAVALLVMSSAFALFSARTFSQIQASGRKSLLQVAAHPDAPLDLDGLASLYPRPEVVVQRYPILLKYRLSVFRDRKDRAAQP